MRIFSVRRTWRFLRFLSALTRLPAEAGRIRAAWATLLDYSTPRTLSRRQGPPESDGPLILEGRDDMKALSVIAVLIGVIGGIELVEAFDFETSVRPRAEAMLVAHYGLDRPDAFADIARPLQATFFSERQFLRTCTDCFHEGVLDNVQRVYVRLDERSGGRFYRVYRTCPPGRACEPAPRPGFVLLEVSKEEALATVVAMDSTNDCEEPLIDGRATALCHLTVFAGGDIQGESFSLKLPPPRFSFFQGWERQLVHGWISLDRVKGTCTASRLPTIAAWLEAKGCTFSPTYQGDAGG